MRGRGEAEADNEEVMVHGSPALAGFPDSSPHPTPLYQLNEESDRAASRAEARPGEEGRSRKDEERVLVFHT